MDGRHLGFLRHQLPGLLEDVPSEHRQSMWYIHDEEPTHFSATVRLRLTRRYGERWISQSGPVP